MAREHQRYNRTRKRTHWRSSYKTCIQFYEYGIIFLIPTTDDQHCKRHRWQMQWQILSQQKPSRRARSSFARGNVASCLVAQLYLIHSSQVGSTSNIHLEQGSMQFEVACPLEGKNIVQTFLLVLHQLCLQAGPPSWSILRPIELL